MKYGNVLLTMKIKINLGELSIRSNNDCHYDNSRWMPILLNGME